RSAPRHRHHDLRRRPRARVGPAAHRRQPLPRARVTRPRARSGGLMMADLRSVGRPAAGAPHTANGPQEPPARPLRLRRVGTRVAHQIPMALIYAVLAFLVVVPLGVLLFATLVENP